MTNLQHPDITACEMTGYPRGMKEYEPEEAPAKTGIADIFADTMAAFEAAEKIMRSNAADLTEMLDATVIGIREYGVQISAKDADFVLTRPDVSIVKRGCDFFPYEASCKIDGVTVFTILEEAPNESAV